jgi:radical S-adenosyl methionine domain-containing protein 2
MISRDIIEENEMCIYASSFYHDKEICSLTNKKTNIPTTVHPNDNSHIALALRVTEACNLGCKFCMNPPPATMHAPMRAGPDFVRVMTKIRNSGMVNKVTFTGGEPLLEAEELLDMLAICHDLGFETTITTNGTLLTKEWLARAASCLSFIGFSIDTLDDSLNLIHGRCNSVAASNQAAHAIDMISECATQQIPYKINTVITSLSWEDNTLSSVIATLPGNFLRWKIIRCTAPPTARCDAAILRPTDDQWKAFETRVNDYANHMGFSKKLFFEDRSDTMQSYLLMTSDWKLEILGEDRLAYTQSIADASVDVSAAIAESGFDSKQAATFRSITTNDREYSWCNKNPTTDIESL